MKCLCCHSPASSGLSFLKYMECFRLEPFVVNRLHFVQDISRKFYAYKDFLNFWSTRLSRSFSVGTLHFPQPSSIHTLKMLKCKKMPHCMPGHFMKGTRPQQQDTAISLFSTSALLPLTCSMGTYPEDTAPSDLIPGKERAFLI